jgi:site-specific DNA recombinase
MQLQRLDEELERLTGAIARGGDLPALLQAVKERETYRAQCESALLSLDAEPRRADVRGDVATIQRRLADWRGLLTRHPEQAREVLQTLVPGPLIFIPFPAARLYEFKGRGSLEPLIRGLIGSSSVVAPTGFEPVFESRSRFRLAMYEVTRCLVPKTATRLKHAPRCSSKH